eukprot:gb/GFBE01005165.1/.p1 GENE.gb/GFBE01005165.1/~~gb/GFBE01005165.1/.p1  ORF type:complete len:571 (+),score=117.69 gb/GFBE01005165.1/:1-1713(+)
MSSDARDCQGAETSEAQEEPLVVDVAAVIAKDAATKQKENDRALAVVKLKTKRDAKVVVPDPYPSRAIPARVLQEEDYAEAVSAIIERDFFPDLPQLRARHELLQAALMGDELLVQALEKRLAEMPRPTPVSAATPGSAVQTPQPAPSETLGATPGPARFPPTPPPGATSAAAARLSAWEREDGAESVATGPGDVATGQQHTLLRLASGRDVAVDLANVRLDDFQRVFTSEDNASFEKVLEKDHESRRQKEWWIEDAELRHNTKCLQHAIAIEDNDYSEITPGAVMTCEFQGRNTLSFKPRGEKGIVIEKPRVEFSNTRFTTRQQSSQDSSLASAIVARRARAEGEKVAEALAKMAKEGSFHIGSLHNHGQEVRAIGGRLQSPLHAPKGSFPLVSTPALVPGEQGMSPLMTFGQIASTPRLIDEESLGPKFSMQEESARDRAADALARSSMQKQRESRQNSKKERLRALGLTPSTPIPGKTPPGTGLRLTPGSVASRVTPMSPIGQLLQRAQRMAQRGGRLKIGTGGQGTPQTPGTPSGSAEPPSKRARHEKRSASGGSSLPASMMDNLL